MGKVHHHHHHHRLHDSSGSGGEDLENNNNNNNKIFHKGPWTSAEDKLLADYVEKNGDGNWNAVQKLSGLSRCGKSCRLRWVNHLRPDLKKGAFTDKEEQRVIELHASMGNKWARMAAELPGRTDNEIKNFWNTRLKRLQRHGLPIYPDDIREQAMNALAQSGYNNNNNNADSMDGQESLEPDSFEIPELDFKLLHLNQCSSYYQSMVPLINQRQCFFPVVPSPLLPNRKRSREPETAGVYDQNPQLWSEDTTEQFNILPDSDLFGDFSSAFGPLQEADEKSELPSFQCFDSQQVSGAYWGTQQQPMLEELESDNNNNNTLVKSPSTFCDGLLESVVYGSSGERKATKTESESTLFQSTAITNTTGEKSDFEADLSEYGSSSSNERRRSLDGDWIRQLLGEDIDISKWK